MSTRSHVPLTFDANDVNLRNAPLTNTTVISCNVAGWEIYKALIDNGSQADIIFLHAFEKIGISPNQLQPTDNSWFGFRGKATLPLRKLILPLSFSTGPNARTEQIIFDVIDMVYPYNTILVMGH